MLLPEYSYAPIDKLERQEKASSDRPSDQYRVPKRCHRRAR